MHQHAIPGLCQVWWRGAAGRRAVSDISSSSSSSLQYMRALCATSNLPTDRLMHHNAVRQCVRTATGCRGLKTPFEEYVARLCLLVELPLCMVRAGTGVRWAGAGTWSEKRRQTAQAALSACRVYVWHRLPAFFQSGSLPFTLPLLLL